MDTGKIKHKIRTTIYPNKVGAINAEAHQALLIDLVDELDEGKQDRGEGMHPEGRYPFMSVGFADALVGRGESTPAEFSFRASGGKSIADGTARIKTLRGNSVVVDGEILHSHIEAIKSVGDNAWDEEWENGYIYGEGEVSNVGTSGIISKNFIPVLANEEYYYLYPQGAQFLYIAYYDHSEHYISQEYLYANSTRRTPTNAAYIKFFAEGVPTYNHDILISLYHSGWKVDTDAGYQPYWADILAIDPRIQAAFPDGMKAAGDAYDAVMNRNGMGCITKRIASIDLGALEWGVDSGGFAYSQSTIPARVDALGVSRNVICAHFGVKQESYWIATTEDVLMIAENGKVFITGDILKDTSASELKDKLDGVILYYESNAPTIYEYDQPFNLDYRVADFGTEEAISSKPSAPLRADIIYQFNAVDMIRDLLVRVQALEGR